MLSISPKPKFFLLNALRALSMISLLFIFIANVIILAEDVKAVRSPVQDKDEDCDYILGSGVPNQPAGEFRAFFSLTLNIIQTTVLFLAEIGLSQQIFKNWLPCLFNESLVAIGILEVLLAASIMSHFLEMFPLVACFFLLIAGIMNILTMYVKAPKTSRSWKAWKAIGQGRNPAALSEQGQSRYGGDGHSFSEKETGFGFGRNGSDQSHVVNRPMNAHLSRTATRSSMGSGASLPNYTMSPKSNYGYTGKGAF